MGIRKGYQPAIYDAEGFHLCRNCKIRRAQPATIKYREYRCARCRHKKPSHYAYHLRYRRSPNARLYHKWQMRSFRLKQRIKGHAF